MSRFRGHIERRIFNAVLLVIAGCDRPLETQPLAQPPPSDAPAAVVVVVPPTGPADARALCANHKQSSPIDRAKASKRPFATDDGSVYENAYWDAKNAVAACTIIHERKPGTVVVMHTPHWCPQGGGSPPAAVARKVEGEELLVERAWVRADGTLTKRELEWVGIGMVNEVRHNCGRRFEGLELDEREACDEPGAQLAAMAELEAASVPAFERLARELAACGAPQELVERAWVAMDDEVRHARVMKALAGRYGHAPRAIAVPPLPCRSLEAIAQENAVEGCVREAYGALVATYQAERARPELVAAFGAIAVDERRHAELSEDVHAWIVGRLDTEARDAVEVARARAEAELRASVMASRACSELGLPGGLEAVALFDAYFA